MTTPADDVLKRIHAENERRLSVGNTLASAIGSRIEAERLLEQAREDEKKAIADAKKAGWSDTELNRITGKTAPKRRARTTSLSTATEETS